MDMMRLFIAICFDDAVKAYLDDAAQYLSRHSRSGRFTRLENFHLTLAFLGETAMADKARIAMDQLSVPPFSLHLGGLGHFKRPGGDLYWLGITVNPPLQQTQAQLQSALRAQGFILERRPFRPHLTLGRSVILAPDFDPAKFNRAFPEIAVPVSGVSLMRSERIRGVLTYTELAYKAFGSPQEGLLG